MLSPQQNNNEFSAIFANLLCHLSLDHMTCMTEPIITAGTATPKKKKNKQTISKIMARQNWEKKTELMLIWGLWQWKKDKRQRYR